MSSMGRTANRQEMEEVVKQACVEWSSEWEQVAALNERYNRDREPYINDLKIKLKEAIGLLNWGSSSDEKEEKIRQLNNYCKLHGLC
jgi:hypothetical protein